MSDGPRRDMAGYGDRPPDPKWPDGARVAVQFVINYEEGGERCVLHGDDSSEAFLTDIAGSTALRGRRNPNVESTYEYGSRAGFWRLHRLFTARSVPVTVYGVATALERNPDAVRAMLDAGWEIASHGLRWIDYQDVGEAEEREHLRRAVEIHTRLTGSRPLGWYTGRTSTEHAPARRRGRRLSLRLRLIRGRPSVLGSRLRPAASRHTVCARHQRHALRHPSQFRQR